MGLRGLACQHFVVPCHSYAVGGQLRAERARSVRECLQALPPSFPFPLSPF